MTAYGDKKKRKWVKKILKENSRLKRSKGSHWDSRYARQQVLKVPSECFGDPPPLRSPFQEIAIKSSGNGGRSLKEQKG